MDTITITVAENDPDVVVSATLNEEAVTITLVEAQDGATGATGAGVAAGGVANDILKKTSSTDYATAWETPTSAATANAVVRRDASGGAAFDALTGTGNWSTTGHFLSNPGSAEAGHFLTKNGTTPTIAAGRSAWFSSSTGDPQFRNGTSSAVTLIYDGGALGTPSSGTLTSCTGLPIATGISGLGTGVATFLATPSSANLIAAVTDETGDGYLVTNANPEIYDIYLEDSINFNNTSYNYGSGSATLHRTALGLTALATTTPGTNVATFLATPTSANLLAALTTSQGTGSAVFATSPTITTPTLTGATTLTGGSLASTANALSITGTMSSANAPQQGVRIVSTASGTAAQVQDGVYITLAAGYTGSNYTIGTRVENLSLGTGASANSGGAANYGLYNQCHGTTAGHNVGLAGIGQNSTTRNFGVMGFTNLGGANNIGVLGSSPAGTNRIGVYGTLTNTLVSGVTAAVVADNGAIASPIFIAYDNGTEVARISDGGGMSIGTTTDAGAGNLLLAGTITTVGPASSTARPMKFGSVTAITDAGMVALGFTSQQKIEINAIAYWVPMKTSAWT